jgi:hypothetical protein
MKPTILLFTILGGALLFLNLSGCSSTGYSGSASYYHTNAWDYDRYYRSGVNQHYNRSAARSSVRSEAANRTGNAARSGGGRRGGGRR